MTEITLLMWVLVVRVGVKNTQAAKHDRPVQYVLLEGEEHIGEEMDV